MNSYTTTTTLVYSRHRYTVHLICQDGQWTVDQIDGPGEQIRPGLPPSPNKSTALQQAHRYLRDYIQAWAQLLL
jgi:hypothetical protein